MSLTNHHGESFVSRADKMSGHGKMKLKVRENIKQLNKKHKLRIKTNYNIGSFGKKFYSKKRRQFLKDPQNWDKI